MMASPTPDVDAATLQLANLGLDQNTAVSSPEEAKEKPKGSRLPFFQKLRRNTSGEKKEDGSAKGR
jgi:hypothetical protein